MWRSKQGHKRWWRRVVAHIALHPLHLKKYTSPSPPLKCQPAQLRFFHRMRRMIGSASTKSCWRGQSRQKRNDRGSRRRRPEKRQRRRGSTRKQRPRKLKGTRRPKRHKEWQRQRRPNERPRLTRLLGKRPRRTKRPRHRQLSRSS